MANENALTIQNRIEARVKLSAALLTRIGIEPAVYERIALNALIRAPQIAQCTPASVEAAVMACIETGLVPDGREAALIPFKGRATMVPMIAGRLKLARQATKGLAFRARCVYEGDEFDFEDGLSPTLRHVPSPTGECDPQKIRAAYAIAHIPGQKTPEYEVMYRPELMRYRRRSLARSGGPWATDPAEMCEKTVLGQLVKRLPWRAAPAGEIPADADDDVAVVGYDWTAEDTRNVAKNLHDATKPEPEQRGEAQVVEAEPEPQPAARKRKTRRKATPPAREPLPAEAYEQQPSPPDDDEFGDSPF